MAVPRIFRQSDGNHDDTWWKELPCPHSPSWGLHDISERDLQNLKQKESNSGHFTKYMVIETHIYRAFLECPVGSFYNQSAANVTKALAYLQKADDCTSDSAICRMLDGQTGYGIVINAFRMWLSPTEEIASRLKQLLPTRDYRPEYRAFVSATHAYILSKLGPHWADKSIHLYSLALSSFAHNYEWIFGKACMIGKKTRGMRLMLDIQRPLPKFIRQKLLEERDMLKRVLDVARDFHHARALYGQALYNISWEDPEAQGQINEALDMDPTNPAICIIFARYYRRKGPIEEALRILKKYEHSEIAEIHCQLGYLYRNMSFKLKDRSKIQELSLKHFNRAKFLDNCHYPSISSAAEMSALLGRTEEAGSLLKEMFRKFWRNRHLNSAEFIAIKQGIEKKFLGRVFNTSEVIDLAYRCIEVALQLLEDNIDQLNGAEISVCRKNSIKTPLKYLENMINDAHLQHRLWAQLKLAHVYRLTDRLNDAEPLYHRLYNSGCVNFRQETVWGLGKYFFMKGCRESLNFSFPGDNFMWEKSLLLADELSELDSDGRHTATELYADVNLAKAKFMMSNEAGFHTHGSDQCPEPPDCSICECLREAIRSYSLESCHIYLQHRKLLPRYFFSSCVPETLAHISLVCQSDVSSLHHTNLCISEEGVRIIPRYGAINNVILNRVKETTKYDTSIVPEFHHSHEFDTHFGMLEDLRGERLSFEKKLLGNGGSWHRSLDETLFSIVGLARSILDSTIASVQRCVMADPPSNSMFVVCFDWNTGKFNKDKARNEVKKWAQKVFKGLDKPPDDIEERIVQMQPMYDESNLWLAGLHSLNNEYKHDRAILEVGETFTLRLKKPDEAVGDPRSWQLRTQDIVQQSCMEVEKFVLFCATRYGSQ